jgi:transaldolase
MLVRQAQEEFLPVWQQTKGNDGYVSFELDPLIEDLALNLPHDERVKRYIELGKKWSAGHKNRMIKVPATPAGLGALEELCAAGVTLNVTLIFSPRQYEAARDAIWRGAQRRADRANFKSVYSIFVSRVDVYTEKHVPTLGEEVASTGTKKPEDPPWKYVEAFAGSDIETNPPATNEAVNKSGRTFTRQVDQLPPPAVEIDCREAEDAREVTYAQNHLPLRREQ